MLTEREKEVAKLVAEGKTNNEISKVLCISLHTVNAHIDHIYDKLNIHSRVNLAIKVMEKNFFNNNIN